MAHHHFDEATDQRSRSDALRFWPGSRQRVQVVVLPRGEVVVMAESISMPREATMRRDGPAAFAVGGDSLRDRR